MNKADGSDARERERALRMLAVQLLGQLPADHAEACRVLEHTRRLLDEFLHEPLPAGKPTLCSVS